MITPTLFPETEHRCRCGAKMEYLPHKGWFCSACEEKTGSGVSAKPVSFGELFRIDSSKRLRVWQITVEPRGNGSGCLCDG